MTNKAINYIHRKLEKIASEVDSLLMMINEIEQKGDEAFTPAERQLSVRLDRRPYFIMIISLLLALTLDLN